MEGAVETVMNTSFCSILFMDLLKGIGRWCGLVFYHSQFLTMNQCVITFNCQVQGCLEITI